MQNPNIVFIISDDTKPDLLHCNGGESLSPNIDSIANNGIQFKNFFTPGPVCMAARYNVLSGHYCGRCPDDNFLERNPTSGPYQLLFNTPINPAREKTIGHIFKENGYKTGYVGKWHTGMPTDTFGKAEFNEDDDPRDPVVEKRLRAFQENCCEHIRKNGFDYAASITEGNPCQGGQPLAKLRFHNLEWITQGALDFINESHRNNNPFFINVAYTAIHGDGHIESLMNDPRLTSAGYLKEPVNCQAPRHTIYQRLMDAGYEFNHNTAGLLWMDDGIGAIINELKKLGIYDNTIIVYVSDHGIGPVGKYHVYEGGVSIPCMMQWKKEIPPNRTSDALLQHIDWIPTLAEAAGASIPDDMILDGKSFIDIARGKAQELSDRDDIFSEYGYSRAVRTKKFKYIAYRLTKDKIQEMRDGKAAKVFMHSGNKAPGQNLPFMTEMHPCYFDPDQLYDLENDPDESINLFNNADYKDIQIEMQARMKKYLDTFEHPFDLNQDTSFFGTDTFRKLIGREKEWWQNIRNQSWHKRKWY